MFLLIYVIKPFYISRTSYLNGLHKKSNFINVNICVKRHTVIGSERCVNNHEWHILTYSLLYQHQDWETEEKLVSKAKGKCRKNNLVAEDSQYSGMVSFVIPLSKK
jgi:hypothetical protein